MNIISHLSERIVDQFNLKIIQIHINFEAEKRTSSIKKLTSQKSLENPLSLSKNSIAYSINLKPTATRNSSSYFQNYHSTGLKPGQRLSQPKMTLPSKTTITRISQPRVNLLSSNNAQTRVTRTLSTQPNKTNTVTRRITTTNHANLLNNPKSTTTIIKNYRHNQAQMASGLTPTILSRKSTHTLPSHPTVLTNTNTSLKAISTNNPEIKNHSLTRISQQPQSTAPTPSAARVHRFSRNPLPSDEYGQRSKSRKLHLVEDNSEYKRFQFVSRSREKTIYRSGKDLSLSAIQRAKQKMLEDKQIESVEYLKSSYAPEKFSNKLGSIRKSNKRVTVIRDGVERQLSVFNRD